MKTKRSNMFTSAMNAATSAINAASGVFHELALPETGEHSFRFRLAAYGEYPVEDVSGKSIIQVVDRQAAETMAANYGSVVGKLANFFRGIPMFEGHADDAAWLAKNPGHKASAVARIKSIEPADDGIYVTAALNSDGEALLGGDAPKYTGQSPYWRLSEIPGRAGHFRPILLWSVALTNNPNIMTNTIALNSLQGMAEDIPEISPTADTGETDNTEIEMKLTPEALAALGFAPDADPSSDEISAAIVQMIGEKAEAEAKMATAEEVTIAANSRLTLVETELNLVRGTAVDTVITEAINTGRITDADKPAWTAALNTSFATESAKLKTLMPVLNTANRVDLGGRREAAFTDAANAAGRITEGVTAFATEKGMDITTAAGWTKAYDACRAAKPELFAKG